MAADRLVVFAKRPAAGCVKTRLTPPLPPDEAATVYEASLRDVIAHAARERARVEVWYDDEPRARLYFQSELPNLPAIAQVAGDLGARMRDAFARSFADAAERVVIIGSDAPTLPDNILAAAFDDLHEVDVVLGPTLDGGYYLIGMRAAAWPRADQVFDDVTWSSDAVFKTTFERCERSGLVTRVLPGWYDVDTIEDLRQAIRDAATDSHLCRWAERPESLRYLNLD